MPKSGCHQWEKQFIILHTLYQKTDFVNFPLILFFIFNFVITNFYNMDISSVNPPLSNIQAELLKVFSADIPDKHLAELKGIIARFLLDKARDKADAVWEEKGYTDKKLRQMLDKK